MSSTRRTRGTRALPPTPRAAARPSLAAFLAEKWSAGRTPQTSVPLSLGDEDRGARHSLTSLGVTIVILLFITLVVPTIIALVRNF